MSRKTDLDPEGYSGEIDSKPSLTDACYAQLRAWIIACELRPGERLNEKDLIERSGFGRTPVREALARLDHDGLVQTIPRSGYRVTPVSRKAIIDLYDVWRLIGPLIARRAAENMTPALRAELEAILNDISEEEPSSVSECVKRSERLITLLAEASQNRELIYINHRIGAQLERLFIRYYGTEQGRSWYLRQSSMAKVAHVYDDPEMAAASLSLSIAWSYQDLINIFSSNGTTDSDELSITEETAK